MSIGKKQTWRIEKALGMSPQAQGANPSVPIWLYGLMPDRAGGNYKPTQRVWKITNALSNSISPGRIQVGTMGYQTEFDVRVPGGQFNHVLGISNGMIGFKGTQQVAGYYIDGRGVLGFKPTGAGGTGIGEEYDHLRLQEPSTPVGYLTYAAGIVVFNSGGTITASSGIEVLFVGESAGAITQLDWFDAPGPYTNQQVTLDRPPIYPNSVLRTYLRIRDVSGIAWYLVDEVGNNSNVQYDPGNLVVTGVNQINEVGVPHAVFSNIVYGGRRFGLAHQVTRFRIPSTYPSLNPSNIGTDRYTEGVVPNGLYFSDPDRQMSEGFNYILLEENINEIVRYQEGLLAFCDTRIYYITGGFTSTQDYIVRELPQAYQYGTGPNAVAPVGPLVAKVSGRVFCVSNGSIVEVSVGGIAPVGHPIIDPTAGDSSWYVVGLAAWQGGNWLVAVLQRSGDPTQAWVLAYDLLTSSWFVLDWFDNHVPSTLQVVGSMDRYQNGSFGVVRQGQDAYLYGFPAGSVGASGIETALPRQVSFRTDLGMPRWVKLLKEITVRVPFPGYVNDTNTYVEVRITTEDGGTGGNFTVHKMKYWNNGYWRLVPNVKSAIMFRVDILIYGMTYAEGTDLSIPNPSWVDMPIEITFLPVREFR